MESLDVTEVLPGSGSSPCQAFSPDRSTPRVDRRHPSTGPTFAVHALKCLFQWSGHLQGSIDAFNADIFITWAFDAPHKNPFRARLNNPYPAMGLLAFDFEDEPPAGAVDKDPPIFHETYGNSVHR